MPVSKAQQKAQNKWIAKTYDRINLTVQKGKKDIIQAHAQIHGESVNGFIGRAIDEAIERDNQKQAKSNFSSDIPNSSSHSSITGFPPEEESQIDLKRLLSDFLYQIDGSAAYGNEVLASLLDKARKQQAAETK